MSWLRRIFGWQDTHQDPKDNKTDPKDTKTRREEKPGGITASHTPKKPHADHHHARKQTHRAAAQTTESKNEPVLEEASKGVNGGIQGLGWYAKSMMQDAEGDVAGGFIHEEQGTSKGGPPGQAGKPGSKPPAGCTVKRGLKVKRVDRGNVVLG